MKVNVIGVQYWSALEEYSGSGAIIGILQEVEWSSFFLSFSSSSWFFAYFLYKFTRVLPEYTNKIFNHVICFALIRLYLL